MELPWGFREIPRRSKQENTEETLRENYTTFDLLRVRSGNWDLETCWSWNQYSMLIRFDPRRFEGDRIVLRKRDYRRAGSRMVHAIQQQNNFPISETTEAQALQERNSRDGWAIEHGQQVFALLHSCSTVMEGYDKPSPVLDKADNGSRRITGTRMDSLRASAREKVPTSTVRPFALHRTAPRHVLGIVGMLA